MNFFEYLKQKEIDAPREYARLKSLFFDEKIYLDGYIGYEDTLSGYLAEKFRKFPYRNTFVQMEEVCDVIEHSTQNRDIGVQQLLWFCEFSYTFLSYATYNDHDLSSEERAQIDLILENINCICEKSGAEIYEIEKKKYIIVSKNSAATHACELIGNPETAKRIIQYNHYALRGHLQEKRAILNDLANYVEPILKARTLQNAGYKQLESDAGFMLNCFHIRHNNKEGAKAQEYIAKISDVDLEELYDKTYTVCLSIIITCEQIKISKEIDSLKNEYKWKT